MPSNCITPSWLRGDRGDVPQIVELRERIEKLEDAGSGAVREKIKEVENCSDLAVAERLLEFIRERDGFSAMCAAKLMLRMEMEIAV